MHSPWPVLVRLADIDRGEVRLTPEPTAADLTRIAADIGVDAVNRLEVEAALKPWLDGAELNGRFDAVVTQTCGVSLEPFETPLKGRFVVRVLPPASPNAPTVDHEISVDPDEEDPPEVLESETVDVGAYVVEHLALEVDPFPRKPGAVFEQPGGKDIISPFAALAALKDKDASN